MSEKISKRMRYRDGKSLATLWAAGTLAATTLLPDGLTGHVRDAYDHFKYSTQTASEMVRGTEGERAIENLADALRIVGEASATYDDARKALESYNANAQDSIDAMRETYEKNETLIREAQRLNINLQGLYKSVSDIGNDLKPDFIEKLDRQIMELYGIDPIEAAEKSESFRNLYETVRDFYERRATMEDVIGAAVGKLEEKLSENEEISSAIRPALEGVAQTLEQTYETEDRIFEEHGRGHEADVEGLREDVENYGSEVEGSKEQVEEFADVPERGYDLITFLLNPAVLGFGAAAFVKGASKGLQVIPFVGSPAEKAFSYATALPTHLAAKGTRSIVRRGVNLTRSLGSTAYQGASNIKGKLSNLMRKNDREK